MSPRGAEKGDPGHARRALARVAVFVAGALAWPACAERPQAPRPDHVQIAPAPSASSAALSLSPVVPPAVPAPSASAASRKPENAATPSDAKRILLEDPELRAWIDARSATTKAGTRERVRIPLVRQGAGWGCVCPPYYVGVDPNVGQGPWLDVKFPKGVRPLRVGEAVIAEGTFGAAPKHVRYPGGPSPAGFWEYDLIVFEVTTTSPLPAGLDESEVALERL